jgi:hypothetical protein
MRNHAVLVRLAFVAMFAPVALAGCAVAPKPRTPMQKVGRYFVNRGNDFVDIFRGSGAGYGLGVELSAKATDFAMLGLGASLSRKYQLAPCERRYKTLDYFNAQNEGIVGVGIPQVGGAVFLVLLTPFVPLVVAFDEGWSRDMIVGGWLASAGALTFTYAAHDFDDEWSRNELRDGSLLVILTDSLGTGLFPDHMEDVFDFRGKREKLLINRFDLSVSATALVPSARVSVSPGQLLDFVLGWFGADIGADDDIRKSNAKPPAERDARK